jgi:hypothetical protein
MKPLGYSGTPLPKKLGIKTGTRLAALNAPADYLDLLGALPDGVQISDMPTPASDLVHVFATERQTLALHLRQLRADLPDTVPVWVSWPKKASKQHSNISEDLIRELALPLGFVDIKVCAVSEIWSGLKLVVRKALRDGGGRGVADRRSAKG